MDQILSEFLPVVTYTQLGDVLASLGFRTSKTGDGATVYKHPASEAYLAFPDIPDRVYVLPHHYLATRMTLDAFGIADPRELAARVKVVTGL